MVSDFTRFFLFVGWAILFPNGILILGLIFPSWQAIENLCIDIVEEEGPIKSKKNQSI